jgi:hypothetical protein
MKPTPMLSRSVLAFCTVLSLGGCTSVENPELGMGVGAALSGIGGYIGGDEGRALSYAGMAISYQASLSQQKVARERAEAALQKPEIKKTVEKKKTRYVAVPVKPAPEQKTKSKNLVMLYDTETGKAKATAYEPKKASYQKNETASFGGHDAVVAQSFAGI